MSSSDGGADSQAEVPEEEATCEEFLDLLAQPREILLQIVNHLDPKSFVKLASTCKYLLNFCQNSKGIHVVFKLPRLGLHQREDNIVYNYSFPCHKNFENERKYVDQLRKWPFDICIDNMLLDDDLDDFTWNHVYEEVKAHFLSTGVKKIRHFELWTPMLKTAHDVENLRKLAKTFAFESVVLFQDKPEEKFEGCLKLPVSDLRISSWRLDSNFNVDSFLHCSIPTLFYDVYLSLEHFGVIKEMWKTRNGLKCWKFYYDRNFNITNYFDYFEIISFTNVIDFKRPPLLMDHGYQTKSFYILRKDGKVLRIAFDTSTGTMEFDICPSYEAPSAFRSL